MTQQSFFRKIWLAFFLLFLWSAPVHAENPVQDASLVLSGAGQIVGGVLALPIEILRGGVQSFPFGIITGAIRGTFRTLGGVFGGAFSAAQGAAPYAKYAAFI